ncbi:hypothetical protein [Lacinutrix jangbogonensis]|uniref:hypothetical protein n=1 Tax=Lacinutrix jangbogonensis TaxID=1469557 RepID=UPI00068C27EF|nr:hypothetical protein [Lacinutrix jangbogonensis]
MKGNYIASVTTLFKNNFNQKEIPKWIEKYPYGDWPIYLLTVNDGSKIKFLNQITANYRKDIGISSNMRKNAIMVSITNLSILKDMYHDKTFFNNKRVIKESIVNHEIQVMSAFINSKQFIKATVLFIKLLPNTNFSDLSKRFLMTLYRSLY